jgi:dTDP-4-amino-4,6-dideoxygalactose transaminase
MKIPYLNLRTLNALDGTALKRAAERVIDSGHYLNNTDVIEFEQLWAKFTQSAYCVSTANGLDALTAILAAMKSVYNWSDNSQVIVSANTFIASFQAIERARLTPVPCDVDPTTYLISPQELVRSITPDTVAIMPVHLYGRICDMNSIRQIALGHNLKIVADACQAHGMCKGESMGDAGAFSFYPGKNLGALGDGGCICTNDEEVAAYARMFCNYGAKEKYRHDVLGINSRLDAIQAAFLSEKLLSLDSQNKQRQQIAGFYKEQINNPKITLPYSNRDVKTSNWHIYPVLCEKRDELKNYLAEAGIETIIHYPIPPHKQAAFSRFNNISMPVAEKICVEELSIPLNPTLTPEQQQHIVDTLNSF